MSHSERSSRNIGKIEISGKVSGEQVVIGHEGHIEVTKPLYQNGQPTIDLTELKASLMDLYSHLQNAGLPLEAQMEAQTAVVQAKRTIEGPMPQGDTLVDDIKKIGDSLQSAEVKLEQGSQVAESILKVAGVIGPLVGSVQVVASWFGIHLPF